MSWYNVMQMEQKDINSKIKYVNDQKRLREYQEVEDGEKRF